MMMISGNRCSDSANGSRLGSGDTNGNGDGGSKMTMW